MAQQMFPATNGRVTGILGLVLAGAVALAAFTAVDQSLGVPLLAMAFLLAVLTYAAVVRPRVGLFGDDLVLRQMFSTTWIPLAAIHDIDIRRVTVIRVEGKKYDTPALARPPRLRDRLSGKEPEPTAADHVGSQIVRAMAEARKRAGVNEWSQEQAALAAEVRSEWSRPLIGMALLGVLAVVLALTA